MVKLVSAKCPSCGASLKLSKEDDRTICDYCHQTIIVDDAIACYKLKISGTISVEGIASNSELIDAANELLDMQEYLKAKRKFLEFSEKCPNNYQGWLGLLICRTRNFTIKDNNIMFENDVNKYYEHFLKVATDEVKNDYVEIIENYLHPNNIEQKIKNTVTKTQSCINFKIDSKFKHFIAPVILIICGLSLLENLIFVGGILWILAGIVLIPKVKEQFKFSDKKAIIIAVVLGVIGFLDFAVESPYGFVGKWESTDKTYYIEFKKDNTYILKINEGEEIKGTFSNIYKNNEYIIMISSDNNKFNNVTYMYYNDVNNLKKLCLYEENACTVYYKKISE